MSTTLGAQSIPVAEHERALAPFHVGGGRRKLNTRARGVPRRVLHSIARILEDAVLLLFSVLLLPLVILLVGTAIAAFLWAVREAARLF